MNQTQLSIAQQFHDYILDHIISKEPNIQIPFDEWYIGITSNSPQQRIKTHQNQNHPNLRYAKYWNINDNIICRKLEQVFYQGWNTDGYSGGDGNMIYIYIFRKN